MEDLSIEVLSDRVHTIKRLDLRKGVEPDAAHYVQNETRVRGKRQINFAVDPPPDLVLTRSGYIPGASIAFPEVDAVVPNRFIGSSLHATRLELIQSVRQWARNR